MNRQRDYKGKRVHQAGRSGGIGHSSLTPGATGSHE